MSFTVRSAKSPVGTVSIFENSDQPMAILYSNALHSGTTSVQFSWLMPEKMPLDEDIGKGIRQVTFVRPLQPEKAPDPIDVMLSGKEISVKEEQSEKAEEPMFVSEDGRAIDCNDEQPQKAPSEIFLRLECNDKDDKEVQLAKALIPMVFS